MKTTKQPEVLSLALRPETLSEFYGQDAVVKQIRSHVAARPPRCWLLSGPPGVGKTSLARIMALAYQCEHAKLWGDPCPTCRTLRDGFAIHEINAAEHSGVEEIEAIIRHSQARPMQHGGKRVIILDECQLLSKQAWSAMLKPTEEPPEFTVWILGTSELAKVPAANQRRPVKIALKLWTGEQREAFVQKQAKQIGLTRPIDKLLEAFEIMSVGSPGIILQSLERYAAGASASEATAGSEGARVDSFRICKALTAGDWAGVRAELKEATADDVYWIRNSAIGWLKGGLLKGTGSPERNSASILELAAVPFDANILLPWLIATLYKISIRFSK